MQTKAFYLHSFPVYLWVTLHLAVVNRRQQTCYVVNLPQTLSLCKDNNLFYVIYSYTVITSCCTIQAARCPQQTELQLKYLFLGRSNFSTYPLPAKKFPELSESYFKKWFFKQTVAVLQPAALIFWLSLAAPISVISSQQLLLIENF